MWMKVEETDPFSQDPTEHETHILKELILCFSFLPPTCTHLILIFMVWLRTIVSLGVRIISVEPELSSGEGTPEVPQLGRDGLLG